ncbi:MAG TPA: universal stress protein [Solirubrobacteraceae bacterium]|nr:universal stress protein [Solirubrobacteraceae bacterium]
MAPHVIVSYDDTENDQDALMLGRLFHDIGAALTLAYVRHAPQANLERELLAAHEAEQRLERGTALLGDPYVERHVVMCPSTSEGLARLADEVAADVITFGPEYRTPKGRVAAGRSAQALLENGPAAVALAPAGYAASAGARDLDTIGVLPGTADEAAIETAFSLAARHEARVTQAVAGVDLLVVGSRPQARPGRVMISSSAAQAIEQATVPVIAVARDAALRFETLVSA